MPKTFYANESDIPENMKGCYEAKNGRWELTNLDNDHPVIVTKKGLETTNSTLKTENESLNVKVGNLEREKTELSSKSVPHGYRAVKKEVAELGEVAVAEGLSVDTVKTLKTENEGFKSKETERADRELKTRALKAAGINDIDGFFELKASDNLKIETEKIGDEEKFYVVTETGGVKEKKVFDTEYLKKTDGFKNSFETLVKKKESGFSFGEQKGDKTKDIYTRIRESVKAEENQEVPSIDKAFGRA